MPRPILLLLAAAALTGLVVTLVLVLDPFADERPAPRRDQPFETTSLEDYDTLVVTVPRTGFCDEVDPREVEAALGAEPDDERSYANGDEVTLADGVDDVAHEFGCAWSLADGSEARAWVFAPPVERGRARRLASEAARADRCQALDAPAYGEPTVALLCSDGSLADVSYRGLFGDAWLACELVAPAPPAGAEALVDRAGAWCAGVAAGASRH